MRAYWGRVSATTGLLVAIFSDLRRRAWWAYRTGNPHIIRPRTTIVARRQPERSTYAPVVTPNWHAIVANALPAGTIETSAQETGEAVPIVWIDVTNRPEIADLPRVLGSGREAGDGRALIGTQWLADQAAHRVVLVVTVVEPVACTWALSFDLPRYQAILAQIAGSSEVFVAWKMPRLSGNKEQREAGLPAHGLLLGVDRPAQLMAILAMWETHPGAA